MKKRDRFEFGICKICGKHKILTEEHIPPKSAFNNGTMKIYSGDEVMRSLTDNERLPWDFEGLKYTLKQGGQTFKTICSKCNSYCGTNYVNYYQMVVKGLAYFLSGLNISEAKVIDVKANTFQPLPFFKQIIAMFASLTDISSDCRDFLLDKESNNFNYNKYNVYMSLFKDGLKRISGWNFILRTDGTFKVAEIVSFPFIFVLLGNAQDHCLQETCEFGVNITSFSKYKFEEELSLEMSLPIKECNINFPCDYRTKEEIVSCRNENLKDKKI